MPICETCNDTHRMEIRGDQMVPCTRCPTPCQRCRAGGTGAFCERTPCACACHAKATTTTKDLVDEVSAVRDELRLLAGENPPAGFAGSAHDLRAMADRLSSAISDHLQVHTDCIRPADRYGAEIAAEMFASLGVKALDGAVDVKAECERWLSFMYLSGRVTGRREAIHRTRELKLELDEIAAEYARDIYAVEKPR